METAIVEHPDFPPKGRPATRSRTAIMAVLACAVGLTACTTVQPPPEVTLPRPIQPAPVIVVQPIQPAAPLPAPPPVLEPPKINEEAEEALALLVDLQKLVLAGPEEQKRELAAATQALSRQKSDVARLRLGLLQSLPVAGADEVRAMATLEPIVKQGNGPTRMVANVLIVQLAERLRSVREEKKRAEDLQQKLDALKALERSLLGRERKPAPAP